VPIGFARRCGVLDLVFGETKLSMILLISF